MTQGLSQFSDPRLFDYVTNNFGAYSIFAVSDREAEPLAKQLFDSRGNRIGTVDELGRPVHFLSVPEQLVEANRLLTGQLRRQFVAKAYGREAALCESFELRSAVGSDAVEDLRRAEARRLGRPADVVERLLQERMRALRALRPTPTPEPAPPPNVAAAGPTSGPTTVPPPDTPAGSPPAGKKRSRSRHDARRADEQDQLL